MKACGAEIADAVAQKTQMRPIGLRPLTVTADDNVAGVAKHADDPKARPPLQERQGNPCAPGTLGTETLDRRIGRIGEFQLMIRVTIENEAMHHQFHQKRGAGAGRQAENVNVVYGGCFPLRSSLGPPILLQLKLWVTRPNGNGGNFGSVSV